MHCKWKSISRFVSFIRSTDRPGLFSGGLNSLANGNGVKTNDLLSYEWFIDNKPLESTTDTIEYEDISYLMNDGMLKCKASNTIGSNTDQIRLDVQCKLYSSWTKCLKTLSVVNIGEAVCTRFFQ